MPIDLKTHNNPIDHLVFWAKSTASFACMCIYCDDLKCLLKLGTIKKELYLALDEAMLRNKNEVVI